jgi:hypothetical protein
MIHKNKQISLLFIIITIQFTFLGFCSAESTDLEALRLKSLTEDSFKISYLKVLEADRVGAKIDELVENLNIALEYLFEAGNAYRSGDYEGTVSLSLKALDISRNQADKAIIMKQTAITQNSSILINRILFSLTIISLTTIFGIIGWKFFKEFYLRQFKGLKYEVNTDET